MSRLRDSLALSLSAVLLCCGPDNGFAAQEPVSDATEQPVKTIKQVPSAYTWSACLEAASKLLGKTDLQFDANSKEQKELIDQYQKLRPSLDKLPEGQILEALASSKVDDINSFLARHGIDGSLRESDDPGAWYAAAVLKLADKWYRAKGKRRDITRGEKTYRGVQLKEGQQVSFYQIEGHPHPVINLWTEGEGSLVYATKLPEGDEWKKGIFNGSHLAHRLTPRKGVEFKRLDDYTHVVLPMVDMDVRVDVQWLLGLGIEDGRVDQALQAFSLKLNEFGFAAKDGVAMGVSRGMSPPERNYEINDTFLFWVTGEDLTLPVLAVVVSPDFWKDPGSLNPSQKR
jgi:hypothetical protein